MSRLFARGKPCHPFGLTAGGSASGAYPPPVKPVIKIARKLLFLLSCLEHTFGRGVGGVAITRTIKTETFRSFLPLVSSGRATSLREPGLSCFAPSQLRCLCPAPPGQRVSIPGCRNVKGRLAASVNGCATRSRRSCARCTPFRGVRGNVVDVAGSPASSSAFIPC